MNKPITHLFAVVILLFGLLVVWTSRWTVLQASALQHNSLNKLDYYASLKIKRGRILADDGTVLAASRRAAGGTFSRTYPQGSLFSQAVGYNVASESQKAGLEQEYSTQLEGTPTGVSSVFGPLGDQQQVGDDVDSTLDPRAQAEARTLLAGREGSVVAIDPRTGAVKVMYSNPTYDDNHPLANCPSLGGVGCQTNLATEGLFPPGSTFKVVTTAAALDTGRYTPESTINGDSPITVSGVPLQNDSDSSYGEVSLTFALTNSINTVYAQVGEALGKSTMETYMKRFGFYATPPLDYPSGQMNPSGEWDYSSSPHRLIPETSDLVDVGREAIGQDKLLVTPLQMAEVVSAVADGGTLMTPHLVSRIVEPDGVVAQSIAPKVFSHVMTASAAGEEKQMMTDVVEEGTGAKANLEGLYAAGKTGTAQIGAPDSDVDDAWFIGMAPVSDPKIAVAVVLPGIVEGYGGTYAAPVAAQIMKTLIGEGS